MSDPNTRNEEVEKMLKKLDHNLHRLLKQAFVYVNLYYFFQGTVLTAVSAASPSCHQWPFFAIVAIVPFLLNGVPLIYCMCKYVGTMNEWDHCQLLKERNRSVVERDGLRQIVSGRSRDEFSESIRYVGVAVCALVLVGFNVVILYGCHSLLCENGDANVNNVDYDDDSCYRLCDSGNKCLKICTN